MHRKLEGVVSSLRSALEQQGQRMRDMDRERDALGSELRIVQHRNNRVLSMAGRIKAGIRAFRAQKNQLRVLSNRNGLNQPVEFDCVCM